MRMNKKQRENISWYPDCGEDVGRKRSRGCGRQSGILQKAGRLLYVVLSCGLFLSACAKTENGTWAAQNSKGVSGVEPVVPGDETGTYVEEPWDSALNGPEAQGTESAQAAETREEVPSLTLVMVGDVLLHTPVAESGIQQDGSYDFDAVFANVAPAVTDADLALVNQEVILGGKELGITGYPSFNAPFELGYSLVDAGFDVVLHATNHALDKGKKGLVNCLDFWNHNYPDVSVLGIHDSYEDQEEIYVYEQNGIRVAVLNYTYGTNGIALPQDMMFGVDLLEEGRVASDLARAEEMADFTIVCPHWGTEYNLGVSDDQRKWTKIFLENGADLVLGTHPHVIEPVEWVAGENGEAMLVYYSLGNFVNWTSGTGEGTANRMVGGMARVELEKNAGGEVYIADYGVEPLVCHLEKGSNGVTVYFLDDYSEELAQRNEIRSQDPAFSRDYCVSLCEEVWGECIIGSRIVQ